MNETTHHCSCSSPEDYCSSGDRHGKSDHQNEGYCYHKQYDVFALTITIAKFCGARAMIRCNAWTICEGLKKRTIIWKRYVKQLARKIWGKGPQCLTPYCPDRSFIILRCLTTEDFTRVKESRHWDSFQANWPVTSLRCSPYKSSKRCPLWVQFYFRRKQENLETTCNAW